MSKHHTGENQHFSKLESAIGGAVATYVVAKTLMNVRAQHKAEKNQAEAPEPTGPIVTLEGDATSPPETSTRELTQQEQEDYEWAAGDLYSFQRYLVTYMKTPYSSRKIVPRKGLPHAPWAYGEPPSYSSLHHDYSKDGQPDKPYEYPYKTGMAYLADLGKEPLKAAVAKSRQERPDSEWVSLISDDDVRGIPEHVIDGDSARQEKARLTGLWSAIEGMGFDTSDLAFAHWGGSGHHSRAYAGRRVSHVLVPYDSGNQLHRIVSNNSETAMFAKDPGLEIRFEGDEVKPVSIDVRVVDIAALRAEMGDEIIPPTPSPRELAQGKPKVDKATPDAEPLAA